jgi:hypothetical protein
LLVRRLGQPPPEMNMDEREEEDRNSNTNIWMEDRQEDDDQVDNFQEGDPLELRNRRLDPQGDRREDAGDLSKVIANLKRSCTYMEMERKDKSKSIVVDKLLRGIDSPFTRQVADYRLPEKFKVPQILSYARDEDPLDYLENFQAHLDLHRTPDEVACRAFLLTLSRNA